MRAQAKAFIPDEALDSTSNRRPRRRSPVVHESSSGGHRHREAARSMNSNETKFVSTTVETDYAPDSIFPRHRSI